MIKNIVFDIGNVLSNFEWERRMRELGFSDECIATLGREWIYTDLWDELDLGVLTDEEALRLAARRIPQYEREIRCFWENADGIAVCEESAVMWVKGFRDRGFGTYVLSNYPKTLFERYRTLFGFLDYMDGYVVSSYEKIMKPKVEIFKILLDRYGLCADECIFTDDRQCNIDGANAVGIHGVLYTGIESTSAEIDRLIRLSTQS